jgi:hypothetical protein
MLKKESCQFAKVKVAPDAISKIIMQILVGFE